MLSYTERHTCRICGSEDLSEIYAVEEMYVNDFPATPDGHRGKAPMTLLRCEDCTLVQLRETIDEEIYRDYWYQSKLNKKIVNNLREIAEGASAYVGLKPGDTVLDIGANDGTLLSMYPDGIRTVGVDPAVTIQEDLAANADVAINDFFNFATYRQHAGEANAKIITAIAMFYDLENPHQFLDDVKAVLASDGLFVVQFMGMPQMVRINDVGNICHEHILYYTWDSLVRLFGDHGLTIARVIENDINGGSWQLWIGHTETTQPAEYTEPENDLEAFVQGLYDNKADLQNFLEDCKQQNKKVYIYGASTKGNTIAQFYDITGDQVAGAAEIHPDKIGRYLVGTGIPIVHEDEARKDADYFLVMPFGFRDIFVEKEKTVDLVFCTPKFEIVKVAAEDPAQ